MSAVEKALQKTQVLPEPAPKADSAKGLVEVAADFDQPLEDFKPYTE